MPILEIIPKDPLLFRDGKPFTAGSSHAADSIFPPKPSVFAGFIRSKIFIDNWSGDETRTWEKVKNQIGNKNSDYGKLQIKAIFLKKENEYYLPAPLDLVKEKRGEKVGTLIPQDYSDRFSYSANIELKTFPFIPKDIKFAENVSGFISWEKFKDYLCGKMISKEDIKEKKDFVESEPRVGIEVNSKTNNVENGKLYSVNFLRFKEECGFAVLYEGVSLSSNNGDYYLGGEKRQIYFEKKEDIKFEYNIKEAISTNKRFKIILITPLEMEDGIEPSGLKDKLNGKARFITAAYKTESIGGWDIAENKPKPIKKYYTAGSVFYYELKDTSKVDDILKLNFESVSQNNQGQIGFGRVLIGIW